MPNHIHGIIKIHNQNNVGVQNFESRQKSNNDLIIGNGKIGVTKMVSSKHKNSYSLATKFYEHIIRNKEEYLKIWNYINTDLKNWKDDRYF